MCKLMRACMHACGCACVHVYAYKVDWKPNLSYVTGRRCRLLLTDVAQGLLAQLPGSAAAFGTASSASVPPMKHYEDTDSQMRSGLGLDSYKRLAWNGAVNRHC